MNRLQSFSQNHVVLFSIIVAVIFVVIFGFGFVLIPISQVLPQFIFTIPAADYLLNSINNIIAFIVLLIFIKYVGLSKDISWNVKGLKKGILYGLAIVIFSVVQFAMIYMQSVDKSMVINWTGVGLAIFYCIVIGLWEELLCRGLLLTNMLKKWAKDERGIFKAIFLSAIIFGGAHIITGLFGNWFASIFQVVYASCMGVLLGAIYVKTRSLASAVALHIIVNLTAYLMPYIFPYSAGLSGMSFIGVIMLFNFIWIFCGYILVQVTDIEEAKKLFVDDSSVD